MDNKINLNFYGVNYQKAVNEKKEAEEKKEEAVNPKEGKNVDANEVLNAMALSGMQNKTFVGLNMVQYAKEKLGETSAARVADSMEDYVKTVELYKNVVDAEFPNLSEIQRQELAQQAALNSLA